MDINNMVIRVRENYECWTEKNSKLLVGCKFNQMEKVGRKVILHTLMKERLNAW